MKSNTELLAIAIKQLGRGGSVFRSYTGLGGGQPWCDAFVYWLYNANGCGSLLPWKGAQKTSCPRSIKWCEKNLAQIPLYLSMPCDLVYFDWENNKVPNHIGIIESKWTTKAVHSIEGNTSGGRVARKNRKGYIQAVFRPHFKPAVMPKKEKLIADGDFGYKSIYMLQVALGITADGILGKETVKALQKKAGTSQDGAWGKGTSKAVQKLIGVKQDGEFGEKSVIALQKWINKKAFPSKPEPVAPTPSVEPTGSKYSGTFPALPPKTAKIAVECAYAYGTKLSKYKYKGGKPKEAYKKRLKQAYPKRSHWKYAKSRAGASCDVFAGTVLKCSGYKSAPHTMSTMVAWCKKHLKKVSKMQNGDILTRTNHVMVVVDLKGKKRVANAHFQDHGGTYGIIQAVGKYTNIWRPTGVSYFSKGDTFTEVKNLRRFLNWYGNYGLDKDGYSFNTAVENAVKDFQTKEGLNPTGKFGEAELKKAKTVVK